MHGGTVRFDNVWKRFRRGERHDSLRDLLPSLAKRLVAGGRRGGGAEAVDEDDFWAVRDVSFDVRPGEALGIIGPNGAGKSTTLKLLTKILRPTRGQCTVTGRVGALIEIAAGFHPDLTGRENVYLQGAIMGMTRADIQRRFDEVVEFAGVDAFIDTPVKRYSSGMNARLGFSIAAHLEPEVLLIDEVLSVGDMAFQQRCLDRMLRFRRDGVALVFVSHNLQAVAQLCDTVLHLEHQARAIGPAHEVIEHYVLSSADGRTASASGGADVDILEAVLVDARGRRVTDVQPNAEVTLRVTFQPRTDEADLTFGVVVHRSTDGLIVYDVNFDAADLGAGGIRAGQTFTIDFGLRANLTRGHYHVECHVCHNPTQRFSRLCPAATFAVSEQRTFGGVADLQASALMVVQ